MPSRLLSLIAILCLSSVLHAQKEVPPRILVFGGYSFLSNSLDGVAGYHRGLNGFDASVAFGAWHNLRFKVDTTAYFGSNLGAPQHPYFLMGGPQYTFRIKRESVFVEGMGGTGGASQTWPANGAQGQTASFAAVVGGGLDTPISRHFAYRIEGGYQYSYFGLETPIHLIPYRIPGLPTNFGRASSGLVWKF